MELGITARYLLSLVYAISNAFVIGRGMESYREGHYGWCGFFSSMAILNIFMIARTVFCEV